MVECCAFAFFQRLRQGEGFCIRQIPEGCRADLPDTLRNGDRFDGIAHVIALKDIAGRNSAVVADLRDRNAVNLSRQRDIFHRLGDLIDAGGAVLQHEPADAVLCFIQRIERHFMRCCKGLCRRALFTEKRETLDIAEGRGINLCAARRNIECICPNAA